MVDRPRNTYEAEMPKRIMLPASTNMGKYTCTLVDRYGFSKSVLMPW